MEQEELESPISNGMWKLIQFSIFIGFMVSNIYFEWGVDGLPAGVMGGMLAWYGTGIANHYLTRWYSRRQIDTAQ